MPPRPVLACISLAVLLLAGCATKPQLPEGSLKTAFAAESAINRPTGAEALMKPERWAGKRSLAGRELDVSSLRDLKLKDKEVVLTFDDGPAPGKTEKVLATLDDYGIKATFLMVGEMAQNHPALAREVVSHGHTVGNHTFRHADLHALNFETAMREVMRGEAAVEKAAKTNVSFFRFPYLSQTARLRAAVGDRGLVILDVDVDSKDYFRNSPLSVTERTMASLRRKGRGIVLMHDIHQRTVTMLPSFLSQLRKEGYSVVTLRYKRSRMPNALVKLDRNDIRIQ